MKVHFWGTRGSLPASVTAETTRAKIFKALKASQGRSFHDDDAIRQFIDRELPFSVKGGYGTNTSCTEIINGDDYVICDAGTGLRDFGNYAMQQGVQKRQTFHIFLSHLHWDHIQGFPFFCPCLHTGQQSEYLRVPRLSRRVICDPAEF